MQHPSSLLMALSPVPGPQAAHKESEEALQKRLDEVSRELCRSQSSHASLRADAEKAQEQQQQMAGKGSTWTPRSPRTWVCATCASVHHLVPLPPGQNPRNGPALWAGEGAWGP